jgi:outer membrane protein OmpA-like peptidoglycan-associated protein
MAHKIWQISSYAMLATMMAACASPGARTAKGGVAGAATGAVVGAATGGGRGAAIGAAVGGAAGAAIGNYLDKRQRELEKVAKTERSDDGGLKVILQNDILFDFDRADVRPEGREQLGKLAEILKKYPDEQLRVEGYADDIGSAEYNRKLSTRRAESVVAILREQGVGESRLAAIGKGELPPATPTDEARAKNRKVEVHIAVQAPQTAQNNVKGE